MHGKKVPVRLLVMVCTGTIHDETTGDVRGLMLSARHNAFFVRYLFLSCGFANIAFAFAFPSFPLN